MGSDIGVIYEFNLAAGKLTVVASPESQRMRDGYNVRATITVDGRSIDIDSIIAGRDDTEIPVAMLRDVAPMVYDALIKRRWEPGDLITRGRAFDEYCMWHGLVGWGPPIRDAMAALGWKLVG